MFAPMVQKLIVDIFWYHVRLGVVPFFGDGNVFRKKLGPKKFMRDKFGYNPPVGTAHGDLAASPAVLVNESAFGRHLWFSLSPRKRAKDAKAHGKKSVERAQIYAKKC